MIPCSSRFVRNFRSPNQITYVPNFPIRVSSPFHPQYFCRRYHLRKHPQKTISISFRMVKASRTSEEDENAQETLSRHFEIKNTPCPLQHLHSSPILRKRKSRKAPESKKKVDEKFKESHKGKKEIRPSREQMNIIESVEKNISCYVDSVAGAGKTSTVLFMAKKLSHLRICQLTYNASLKDEVRKKQYKLKLRNLEVHSYHSFGFRYFHEDCRRDDGILRVCEGKVKPKNFEFDVLVIDEVQDMTPLFFKFVNILIKVLNKNSIEPVLCILGDRYQGIFKFRGADSRYLTLASTLYVKKFNLVSKKLQLSYRLTKNVAAFVNRVMLGEDRILARSKAKNAPVQFWFINEGNVWNMLHRLASQIKEWIAAKKYKPEDIFVLAASLKGKTHLKTFENILVENQIPVYMPLSEDSTMKEDPMKNKIVFTTFCLSKGLERKVVIIYGFDETYFMYYATKEDPTRCTSALYVGTTRALERLILLQLRKPLPFLDLAELKDLIKEKKVELVTATNTEKEDFLSDQNIKKRTKSNMNLIRTCRVTDLARYIADVYQYKLDLLVNDLFIQEGNCRDLIPVVSEIQTKDKKSEEVSDLIGLAVPAMYETRIMNRELSTLYHRCQEILHFVLQPRTLGLEKVARKIFPLECKTSNDFVKVANVYHALNENIQHRLSQVLDYDWFNESCAERLLKNMELFVKSLDIEFEVIISPEGTEKSVNIKKFVEERFGDSLGTVKLSGIIDAVDPHIAWEFKVTSEIQLEHKLQLCIYAFLWKESGMSSFRGDRQFKLLNIRSAELLTLHIQDQDQWSKLEEIIYLLLWNKYGSGDDINDENFIKNNIFSLESSKIYN